MSTPIIAIEKVYLFESFISCIYAKSGRESMTPRGKIQTLRSGESGKCWSPPVAAPNAIASPTERSIFLSVFFVSFSRRVPMTKTIIQNIAVRICLVPLKNP